ncbi:MAG: ATP-binding protein [Candidatus Zixiibacteriota bacterium]
MTELPGHSDAVTYRRLKLVIIASITALTIAIHYGWLTERLFGHVHWLHALHSRFCYIPIAIAASWFGIRGGIYSALVISLLIVPYLLGAMPAELDLTQELVEIFFYFAIGILVGALIDREINVRKKHEETKLQLERSHHLSLVGQMAAGVAHEIKNPLASIKGALEIIHDQSVPRADREEFSDIAFKEVKRIEGTVTEFLEFARPKETQKERLNLSGAVESSVRQLLPQVSKASLAMVSHIEPGIWIMGDAEKVHQILLNLLLNSIEASRAGDTITIELRRNARRAAVLSISDTGAGMGPEEVAQAFDPFYTTKAAGTGLGLPIVKTIVDRHDGQIKLVSKPGKGTRVNIVLPTIERGAQR